MTNFAHELEAAVAEAPDRPAVRMDDIVLNYAALDAAVARAAGLLRARGVGPGDRVGLQMPNVPYFPIIYYGELRLGAVVVPLKPLLKGSGGRAPAGGAPRGCSSAGASSRGCSARPSRWTRPSLARATTPRSSSTPRA